MMPDILPRENIVNTDERRPKYVTVREWLTDQILKGELQPGDQLPTESKISKYFDVSRVTVRRALGDMQNSGMIEARHGQGYFVQEFTAELDLRCLQGLQESLDGTGLTSTTHLLSRETIAPPKKIRKQLNLEPEEQVLHVRRLRSVNGKPVCHENRYFRAGIMRDVSDQDLELGDVCTLLENRLGVPIAYGDVVLDIVEVPADILGSLKIDKGAMVVRSELISFDVKRVPLEVCTRYAIAGAFRYRTRVGRE